MKNKKRNQLIDVLKGIAVLAVLLGHAIQRGLIVNYECNILFKIIYSFHMPLFMILSGYSLSHYVQKYNFDFLKKRFSRLIIPTVIWSYIIYFFRNFNFVGIKDFVPFPNSILEYSKILVFHPDYIIWFLYIVFWCDIIFFLQRKIINLICINRDATKNSSIENIALDKCKITFCMDSRIISIVMTLIFSILIYLLPNQNFGILRLQIYFPLFSLGYYISEYPIILEKTKYLVIPSIFLYLFLFPRFNVLINSKIIYYLISISSIIIIYYFTRLVKLKKLYNVLAFFGKRSLEIYLCQCLCLNIGIGNGYLKIISIFISATIISVILSYITRSNKILKLILYGIRE